LRNLGYAAAFVTRVLVLLALSCSIVASPAAASEKLDVDVDGVTLRVNARGEALVGYTKRNGERRDVLVWGAVNARPPSGEPQVRFAVDYSAGWKTRGRRVASSFRDACRQYDGPALPLLVAACTAPDGSFWALQRWQRLLPLRGLEPFRPQHAGLELHLSHWTGALPELEVSPNWTYGGRWQGLFGRLSYHGTPVFGTRTPTTRASDGHARYVYIDTYNSAYGPGWRRDAAKVTHVGNGAFCYSFVPQTPPPGYPTAELRGPGNGERHRVTAMGPGVTPIVQWEGAGLQRFEPAADRAFDTLFDRIVGPADGVCRTER
jgi:hypothetical protein